MDSIKLTQFTQGGGCGCKIAPQILEEILSSSVTGQSFPSLLVGNTSKDDAAVYQINEIEAIISTTDFFTPIVDDPYVFGQVAAANAISDVYAMGGTPIMALAILGWPLEKLPTSVAQKVLEGARSICSSVNIPIAGGHSIHISEPIFGLSVNGIVPIKHLKQNNTAQVGDVLLLTKPLGIGVLATASKRGVIMEEDVVLFHQQLIQVNTIGAELGKLEAVHAITDVTGFGLAGHLIEMAEGSKLAAILEYSKVPILPSAKNYINQNIIPDATYRNWKSYGDKIKLEASANALEAFKTLPDPQTNGGLLLAVHPQKLLEVQQILSSNGLADFIEPIGYFIASEEKSIIVR